MFNRTIIEKLKVWADSQGRKPLVLRGARQVGKTTAVEILAGKWRDYLAWFINSQGR